MQSKLIKYTLDNNLSNEGVTVGISDRYHVYIGKEKKRTTISLDNILSNLYQIKLTGEYNTEESYAAAREAIQKILDDNKSRHYHSATVRSYVIYAIADVKLLSKL